MAKIVYLKHRDELDSLKRPVPVGKSDQSQLVSLCNPYAKYRDDFDNFLRSTQRNDSLNGLAFDQRIIDRATHSAKNPGMRFDPEAI